MSKLKHRRRPGRPFQSPEEVQLQRRKILHGAKLAYASLGIHAVTVDSIAEAAGFSRPTFYRHFANGLQTVELVVAEAYDDLASSVIHRLCGGACSCVCMYEVLDALCAWSDRIEDLIEPLRSERDDESSPVFEHRRRAFARVHHHLGELARDNGWPALSRVHFECIFDAFERLVYERRARRHQWSEANMYATAGALVLGACRFNHTQGRAHTRRAASCTVARTS